MDKKTDELLDSNYDGIKEYDNDLPNWWSTLFIITIVFAVIYSLYFTVGPGLSSDQRLAVEMDKIKQLKNSLPVAEQVSAEDLLKLVNDPKHLENGKTVFAGKCAACHGDLAQGVVGPNLTDEYTLHGGKIEQIKHTIEVGVLDKGMLAWKDMLSSDEIADVTAYVVSLKSSNPPNPKEPQGEVDNG